MFSHLILKITKRDVGSYRWGNRSRRWRDFPAMTQLSDEAARAWPQALWFWIDLRIVFKIHSFIQQIMSLWIFPKCREVFRMLKETLAVKKKESGNIFHCDWHYALWSTYIIIGIFTPTLGDVNYPSPISGEQRKPEGSSVPFAKSRASCGICFHICPSSKLFITSPLPHWWLLQP